MFRREFFGQVAGGAGAIAFRGRIPGEKEVAGSAGVFDVSAYGATGDGRTDDSDAVGKAIDAAHGFAGGGAVFFPPGTFMVRRALVLQGNGVRFVGSGQNATKVRAAAPMDALVQVGSLQKPVYGWGLEALRLDGPDAAVGQGVLLRGAREGRITDVAVLGIGETAGVFLDGRGSGGCWSNRISRLWVSKSRGLGLIVAGEVNATFFEGCGFTAGGTGNVSIRGGKALWFTGCQFEQAQTGPELALQPEAGGAVAGFTVAQSWFEVRKADPRARGVVAGGSGGAVRGSVVRDCWVGGNDSAEVAVECLDASVEMWVGQNTFVGFQRGGVLAHGGSGVHAEGFGASARYTGSSDRPLVVSG